MNEETKTGFDASQFLRLPESVRITCTAKRALSGPDAGRTCGNTWIVRVDTLGAIADHVRCPSCNAQARPVGGEAETVSLFNEVAKFFDTVTAASSSATRDAKLARLRVEPFEPVI